MKYTDAELIERLAAEYVLGTLKGPARLRFERLMEDSYSVRMAVWEWEAQLSPLVSALPEEKPPTRVWRGIQRAISPGTQRKLFRGLTFWRGWGLAATTAAVAMMMVLVLMPARYQPDSMAVFNDDKAQPLWIVTSDTKTGELHIKAINVRAEEIDQQAYELWMLPADGTAPRSMGLMPVSDQKREVVLSPQILSVLQQSKGLAISIEPPGGSPTGAPTGPVVYQSSLIEL